MSRVKDKLYFIHFEGTRWDECGLDLYTSKEKAMEAARRYWSNYQDQLEFYDSFEHMVTELTYIEEFTVYD